MRRKDILQRLEERLARGEISEKTYLDIKARYDAEPEEPAPVEEVAGAGPGLEASIHETVARATEEASRAVSEAMRAAGDAMRAVDFTGAGVKLTGEEIKIVGSGVVSGSPVKTMEFKVAGSGRVHGPLECESAKVAGSCDFDADVRCSEFRSSGSTRIAGSLRASDVDVSGSLDLAKDLEAADISVSGSIRVNGEVRAQDFRSTGSVRVGGRLQAPDVDIELGGSSRIGAIEGQDVSVRSTGGFLRPRGDLSAESIKGVDVDLEFTNAPYVEGRDVRIGPHCRIGVVVAQDLVVHESSEVKERRVPGA